MVLLGVGFVDDHVTTKALAYAAYAVYGGLAFLVIQKWRSVAGQPPSSIRMVVPA